MVARIEHHSSVILLYNLSRDNRLHAQILPFLPHLYYAYLRNISRLHSTDLIETLFQLTASMSPELFRTTLEVLGSRPVEREQWDLLRLLFEHASVAYQLDPPAWAQGQLD